MLRSRGWALVAVLALAPLAAGAGSEGRVVDDEGWCRESGDDRPSHCEVREVPVSADGLLAVDARPNGGIAVHGWDRPGARLRVKVYATAETEAEARALAAGVLIETKGAIRATGPARSRERNWYASFRLDVPRSARVRLQADNGGLHLDHFDGTAELHTVNGGIHVEGGAGRLEGETVNGGLHLELAGTGWTGPGVNLRTTNGGLHLRVPDGYNARLEASTVNGGIDSDVPVTTRGRHTGGRIETDLGRGGTPIRVETTNGGLRVEAGGRRSARRTRGAS